MARARNIKPGFFINEVIAELPYETRLLFIGLWTLADREGRLEDRPRRIKGNLFPYDSFDVDPMLNQLHDNGFLVRYEVSGASFIQITNFVKHQDPHYKEKASAIPGPDGSEDFIKATNVTRSMRMAILQRDNHECRKCGAKEALCIDHIIPVSRGGDSSEENLQVLCNSCNTKKGNKLDGEQKGFNKSKHNQQSIISRIDFNAKSIQKSRASPSDSLIPDSLIPDSLIPDSLIPDSLIPDSLIPEKQKTEKKLSEIDLLKNAGIDGQLAKDFLKVRKAKKAPLTETAIDGIIREAGIAGITLSEAVTICVDRNWQGFNSWWDWKPKPDEQVRAGRQPAQRQDYGEYEPSDSKFNDMKSIEGKRLI